MHLRVRPYRCNECGKKLSSASTLRSHLSIVHQNKSPFPCEKCGKHFSSKYALIDHQKVHTNDRPHQCPLCLQDGQVKRFKFISGLYNHVTNVHYIKKRDLSAEPIYCKICKRLFRAEANMLTHVLLKHTGNSFTILHNRNYNHPLFSGEDIKIE